MKSQHILTFVKKKPKRFSSFFISSYSAQKVSLSSAAGLVEFTALMLEMRTGGLSCAVSLGITIHVQSRFLWNPGEFMLTPTENNHEVTVGTPVLKNRYRDSVFKERQSRYGTDGFISRTLETTLDLTQTRRLHSNRASQVNWAGHYLPHCLSAASGRRRHLLTEASRSFAVIFI